jgi:hypothetical protein
MTPTRTLATIAITAATLALAAPAAAVADSASGRQFGQHVRVCAQTMGFTGEHNPGMHHGYAGWNDMTCDN